MLRLKPEELKEVENFAKETQLGKLLTEMKTWGFQVGDVLVRTTRTHENKHEIDMMNDASGVPKKFKVVFIDDLGIPWIKQLSVRGGLGNKMYCLANMDAHRHNYKIDPEQLDAFLLGYKYDPRIEYKRMRSDNPNYGKSNETK